MHDNSIRMGDYDDERYCWNHFQSDYFPGNKLFLKNPPDFRELKYLEWQTT